MKMLPLTNTDEVSLVDDEDYDELIKFKWYKNVNGYVILNPVVEGKPSILHRIILRLGLDEAIVDHIDRNKLNNQKSNLRLVSHSDNMRNSKLHSVFGKTSEYKGVSKDRRDRKWAAYISINDSAVRLLTTRIQSEAGYAYDCATSFLNVLAYKNNCDGGLSELRRFQITVEVINRMVKRKNYKQFINQKELPRSPIMVGWRNYGE